jgi:hypothetical protein
VREREAGIEFGGVAKRLERAGIQPFPEFRLALEVCLQRGKRRCRQRGEPAQRRHRRARRTEELSRQPVHQLEEVIRPAIDHRLGDTAPAGSGFVEARRDAQARACNHDVAAHEQAGAEAHRKVGREHIGLRLAGRDQHRLRINRAKGPRAIQISAEQIDDAFLQVRVFGGP